MSNNGQSKLVFVVQLILKTIVLFQTVFLLRKNTIKNKPTAPYWVVKKPCKSLEFFWNYWCYSLWCRNAKAFPCAFPRAF